jgi:hypothetical protein
MKNLMLILVSVLSLNAFGQDYKFFSVCEKTGDATMTWEEFSKCSKELKAKDAHLRITSFTVSILAGKGEEKVFMDYPIKGSVISQQAIDAIEKAHKEGTFGGKILIEKVMIAGKDSDMERNVPGMIINIK